MVLDFLQRHRWLRLFICFLVAFVLFCFPIIRPVVTAHALALTTGAIIAVVSTFLLFTGITFASEAERDRVSLSFYNKSSSAFKEWVNNSVIQFPGTPPSGGNDKDPKDSGLLGTVLSIPAYVLTAGVTAAAAMFTAKKGEVGKVEDTSGLGVQPWQQYIGKSLYDISAASPLVKLPFAVYLNQLPASSPDIGTPITSLYPDKFSGKEPVNTSQVLRVKGISGVTYDYKVFATKVSNGLVVSLAENDTFIDRRFVPFEGTLDSFSVGLWLTYGGYESVAKREYGAGMIGIYFGVDLYYIKNEVKTFASTVGYVKGFDVSAPGYGHHVSRPCTFEGLVNGNTGVVSPNESYYNPSTLSSRLDQIEKALAEAKQANQPIEIKVPETAPELVNSPWQDVVNAQDKYIEALERRIAALEQGLDPDPVSPPDPPTPPDSGGGDIGNAGDLKLPDLKLPADVTKVFPFCIPFDVVRAFEVFTAEPVPPRFVIPFKVGEVVNEEIVLDFSQFGFIIEIIRWGELLIFTVGLAVATRNYIKW